MQKIGVWRRMMRHTAPPFSAKQLGAELEADEERDDAPAAAAAAPRTFSGWVSDWFSVLTIAGCVAGGLLGLGARGAGLSADELKVLGYAGELFVRSLKATLSPMIFASMICCMNIHAGGRDSAATPRLAVLFYGLTTLLASTTGVLAFLLVRPGGGLVASDAPPRLDDGGALERASGARVIDTLLELGRDLVPNNMLKALVEMELLSVITSGIALGVAIRHTAAIHPDATAPMLALAKGTFEALLMLIGWLVLLAPLGVASMVASCVASTPDLAAVAGSLGLLVACTVGASVAHVVGSLSLVLAAAAPRRNPWRFLRGVLPAASMAFGTASSAATLSTTMESVVAQGVRREVANFVLPLGCARDAAARETRRASRARARSFVPSPFRARPPVAQGDDQHGRLGPRDHHRGPLPGQHERPARRDERGRDLQRRPRLRAPLGGRRARAVVGADHAAALHGGVRRRGQRDDRLRARDRLAARPRAHDRQRAERRDGLRVRRRARAGAERTGLRGRTAIATGAGASCGRCGVESGY
jgi:Na+/H+-dicarboxylate symporter